MKNRRSILLSAGALLLASGIPALAQQGMTRAEYVGAVAARYVDPSPKSSYSKRYALQEAATHMARLMPGSILTKGADHAVISVPEATFFDFPEVNVRSASVPVLTEVARVLLDRPDISLEIMAHYHSDGRPAHAMVESGRRAVAIQSVLMSRKVSSRQVVSSGLGEAWPLDSNHSIPGREQNRRIDFVIRNSF